MYRPREPISNAEFYRFVQEAHDMRVLVGERSAEIDRLEEKLLIATNALEAIAAEQQHPYCATIANDALIQISTVQ
jgi:hypothetical protein